MKAALGLFILFMMMTLEACGSVMTSSSSAASTGGNMASSSGQTAGSSSSQSIQGSASGLVFTPINGGTEYAVAAGVVLSGNVVIPATWSGLKVTSILSNGFELQSGITGISIPSSVTNIGDNAFELCTGLTSVVSQ